MDIKLLICLQLMLWGFFLIDKIKTYNYLRWRCQDLDRQIKESFEQVIKEYLTNDK